MKLFSKLFMFMMLFLVASCNCNQTSSPSGGLKASFVSENDTLFFSMSDEENSLMERSPIIINVNDELVGWSIVSQDEKSVDDSFSMIVGETREVNLSYNEREVALKGSTASGSVINATLFVRLYNGAMAYRFIINSDDKYTIVESSRYNFSDNSGTYIAPNGEQEPIGPVKISELNEGTYEAPMIYQVGGYTYAIHESDLHNYPQLRVKRADDGANLMINAGGAEFDGVAEMPWRVIFCGKSIEEIHNEKDIYLSLSKAPQGDFSWVKPGISTWDWRVKGTTFNNEIYEMTTKSLKRYLDFCSRNGLQYFLLDAEWYDPAKPIVPVEGLDIEEVIRYGNSIGVGVLLYYDLHYVKTTNETLDFEYVAKTFASWGAKGMKYGFLSSAGTEVYSHQGKVKRTEEIVQIAAKYKLIIDFHDGPVPFGGMHRQYPNYITREFCHAQMDRRWAFTPGQFVKMACINMMAGPIDQTNGTYALNTIKERSKGPMNEYYSTVASETARFFITNTGNLSVLIDAPEAYEQKSDIFDFIKQMPESWDEVEYLGMEFEKYVSVARRDGANWFVGTVYNEQGGEHTLKLDFLKACKKYEATIYRDAEDTDYINNKESYKVEKREVSAGDQIIVKVVKGGGFSVLLKEIGDNTNLKSDNSMSKSCESCKFRAQYDKNNSSFLGKLWRWHIDYCPGWKAYINSIDKETKKRLENKYSFFKYR